MARNVPVRIDRPGTLVATVGYGVPVTLAFPDGSSGEITLMKTMPGKGRLLLRLPESIKITRPGRDPAA